MHSRGRALHFCSFWCQWRSRPQGRGEGWRVCFNRHNATLQPVLTFSLRNPARLTQLGRAEPCVALLLPIFHVFSRSRGPAPGQASTGGSSPGAGRAARRRLGTGLPSPVPVPHPGTGSPPVPEADRGGIAPQWLGFCGPPEQTGARQGRAGAWRFLGW